MWVWGRSTSHPWDNQSQHSCWAHAEIGRRALGSPQDFSQSPKCLDVSLKCNRGVLVENKLVNENTTAPGPPSKLRMEEMLYDSRWHTLVPQPHLTRRYPPKPNQTNKNMKSHPKASLLWTVKLSQWSISFLLLNVHYTQGWAGASISHAPGPTL